MSDHSHPCCQNSHVCKSEEKLLIVEKALESSMKLKERMKILIKYYGGYAIRYCMAHHWKDTGYVCGYACQRKLQEALRDITKSEGSSLNTQDAFFALHKFALDNLDSKKRMELASLLQDYVDAVLKSIK